MAQASRGGVSVVRRTLGPYATNCYLIVCKETHESVLIDAPAEPEEILAMLEGSRLRFIVITHNHMDHTGVLADLKAATGTPVAAHPADAAALPVPPDLALEDGRPLSFGAVTLDVLHVPGHTPGSVSLRTGPHLFSGDTLFPGGPGHTRAPENLREIVESIVTRLYALPDDTIVYPGHGEGTTIGQSKAEYAVFVQRDHDPQLCGDVLWLES